LYALVFISRGLLAPRCAKLIRRCAATFMRAARVQLMSSENDKRSVLLRDFFYEIPFRGRGGTRVARGISYSGALQIMHAWNARHPDNPICLGQPQVDEMMLAFLKRTEPETEYLALCVPAWYAKHPEGRVYGRCAERVSSLRDPATGFVASEHKAIRNAILMLVPPRVQAEAVAQYERLLEGPELDPALPPAADPRREELLREIKRRLLTRGVELGELDARAEQLAARYEAEGAGQTLDEFLGSLPA